MKLAKGLLTIAVVLLFVGLFAAFAIVTKGLTNWDPSTWGEVLKAWGDKFKEAFNDGTTTEVRLLIQMLNINS